ncbi:MAG: hypothetical protein KH745_03820 [Bilophila sp.]|nr:hypothetical protein [Bilophila sp.]
MRHQHDNDHLAMLAEFMTAMEQPVSQGWEDLEGIRLGLKLITEEARELEEAALALSWNSEPNTREDLTKELADLVYVCWWLAARIGIDLNATLRLVHASNMSKLGPDGKPVKRGDGKVLKGPNYRAPDLSDIVRHAPVTLA